MNGILDTAVVFDILRSYPPALHWLETQESLGVPPIVWPEILEGAADSRAQRRAVQLLRRFERVHLLPEDFIHASEAPDVPRFQRTEWNVHDSSIRAVAARPQSTRRPRGDAALRRAAGPETAVHRWPVAPTAGRWCGRCRGSSEDSCRRR